MTRDAAAAMRRERDALFSLGRMLEAQGYAFVTPTPSTHARVVARKLVAEDLRDVFGWNLPFEPSLLPSRMRELLVEARACELDGSGRLRSTVRFSTLGRHLFAHSAYPTVSADSVFFGPDTYRFCAFVARHAPRARYVVDVGAGTGAGGIIAAEAISAERLVLTDVNPRALAFAEINARLAGVSAELRGGDLLAEVDGAPDLVIANPPYLRDSTARAYRHGGGRFGEAISVRLVREAAARLAEGGTLLLYTGAPIVDGRDVFFDAIRKDLEGFDVHYEELDPDVFGETLDEPGYEGVERIAAVGLWARRAAR